MRAAWIEKRRGSANVSQMHFARTGTITEEMLHVARREQLPAEPAERARRHRVDHGARKPRAVVPAVGQTPCKAPSRLIAQAIGEIVPIASTTSRAPYRSMPSASATSITDPARPRVR